MDPTEVQSIDQGVFAFPKPTFRHGLGYFFSIVGMFIAFGLYSSSLIIPDVPRVDEADVLPYLHDDMAAYEYGPLQDGYDVDEYANQAAFVVVPLELVEGTVAYDECKWVEDDEGGGSWDYSFSMEGAQPLTMADAEGTVIRAAFSLEGSLSPEGEMDDPACGSDWSRTIAGNGMGADNFLFNAFVLVEENPPRYQLLSVKEIGNLNNPSNDPQEVTQREDRGRWALLSTGVAGLIFMYSTSPPLMDNLRKIRKANRSAVKDTTSAPGVLGFGGRLFPHFGPNFQPLPYENHPARSVNDDWLFGAPVPSSFNDPYAGDQDGKLIREPIFSQLAGRRIQGGKGRLDDTGTRVPLIVNWPSVIEPGSRTDALIDMADFFPTSLQLAGATVDQPTDGISFLPVLHGKASERSWAYSEHRGKWWVRDQRYKLHHTGKFVEVSQKNPGKETELKGELTAGQKKAKARLKAARPHD